MLAYVKWELPDNWTGKNQSEFFDYSNSKEYFLQPDVVEYKENSLIKPGFDLILGSNTLKELGIVLDFRTKEIT